MGSRTRRGIMRKGKLDVAHGDSPGNLWRFSIQHQQPEIISPVLHPRGDSESGAIGNLIFTAGLAFYRKMITVVRSQNLNPDLLMMKREMRADLVVIGSVIP